MINWDEVIPSHDVDLSHVNAGDAGVIVMDKEDMADAIPDAWERKEPEKAVEVIYVRPVVRQEPEKVQDLNVQAFGGGGAVKAVQHTQPGEKINLMGAMNQWATRPADERFWTVEEMTAQCAKWKAASHEEKNVDLRSAQVLHDSGRMIITGGGLKGPSEFNHYSFGQLCQSVSAPADYLRRLNGDLAAQCITSGMRSKDADKCNVLVRTEDGGGKRVGAFLGNGYSRIWNADIVRRLGNLQQDGWRVPPARPSSFDDPRARPATEADLLESGKSGMGGGLQVKVGDMIAPAGLYASDRDCFAFMVKEMQIEAGGGLLNRGFFVSNSEVGNKAFSLWTFLYDAVCGNHIVWGASEVSEVRIIHRGQANERWLGDLHRALVVYANKNQDTERKLILSAMTAEIAHDKDSVVEKLFKDKRINVSKRHLEAAYDWSVREAKLRGNVFKPNTVWGMVCGLTRVSQECGWANERVAMDQAAGKLLTM